MNHDFLFDIIKTHACHQPQKIALMQNNIQITYAQLSDAMDKVAAIFQHKKMSNQVVALYLPNCIELVYAYLGCFRSGAIAQPISFKSKASEMEYALEQTQTKYLITNKNGLAEIDKINRTKIKLKQIILIDQTISDANYWSFLDFLNHDYKLLQQTPEFDAPAAIFYTSGSTGKPKGVTHSHHSLVASADNMADGLGMNEKDRLLVCEAITNASGCEHVFFSLFAKGTAIIVDEFNIHRFAQQLQQYRPTLLCIMGKGNFDIMADESLSPDDFKSVRLNVTGGDKVTKQLIIQFKEKTGVPLVLSYGLSEILCIAINKSDDPRKIGSVGKAMKGIQMKLLDKNSKPVMQGDAGELWVRGPNMMLGYWKNQEETARTIVDGWLRTGDLVSQDQDGYYWFRGRIKQLIIREGSNIAPLEVEETLMQHPAVHVAAVVGKSDTEEGEVPVAFVEIKKNAEVTIKELIEFASVHLEDYKVPVEIHIMQQLPRTKTHKIDRGALKILLEKSK